MESEDGVGLNLSLNLIPDDVLATLKKQPRGKIFGDRRSRVKQRKEARNEKREDARKSGSGNASAPGRKRKLNETADSQSEKRGSGREVVEGSKGSAKKSKSNAVISSLFRKNPEIPVISNTEVESVQENVFSGDSFRELPLHPYLISNLEERQGFKQLTEVQKQTIPILLRGKDALVRSQTGSGKTLVYAVPIVQSLQSRMVKVRREDGPYALIIVPTRELALQIHDLFQKLLHSFVWVVPGCLMGGEKRKAEKSRLRKGINILVATPGRLMDHINTTGVLSLARVRWLVIDEADRLMELGYERDVAQVLTALNTQCPDPPQTVLLSATLSQGVERLSSITLNDPVRISTLANVDTRQPADQASGAASSSVFPPAGGGEDISQQTENFSLPAQLKQHFIVTPCKLRLVLLAGLILWKCKFSQPSSKMIVFLSTQDSVEFHARLFAQVLGCRRSVQDKLSDLASSSDVVAADHRGEEDADSSDDDNGESNSRDGRGKGGKPAKPARGLQVFKLHGDMEQKQRSQTFHDFTSASSGVLLCTDVAARGLDLPHVDWIVQYTSPGAVVDYIHRVGRTARAGSHGCALLFLMPSEAGYVQELNKHKISLTQFDQSKVLKCLLENVSDLPKSTHSSTSGLHTPRTQEEAATYLQDRFEECLLDRKELHGLAAKGFQSYIRGYATYSKEVKDIFKVGNLHLGHVAKSFALRETPANIQGIKAKFNTGTFATGSNNDKWRKEKEKKPSKRPLSFKQATLSEFSSGFRHTQPKRIMAKPGGKMKPKAKSHTNKKKKFSKSRTS